MSAPETFAAIEAACRRLVLLAVACVDRDEPGRLVDVFTTDAVLERPSGGALAGCDAIVESYRSRPADRITRHLVTNTLVEILSPTRATARSTVLVWAGDARDAPTPNGRPVVGPLRVGEFDDRFVATPQGWRIDRREARFVLFAS